MSACSWQCSRSWRNKYRHEYNNSIMSIYYLYISSTLKIMHNQKEKALFSSDWKNCQPSYLSSFENTSKGPHKSSQPWWDPSAERMQVTSHMCVGLFALERTAHGRDTEWAESVGWNREVWHLTLAVVPTPITHTTPCALVTIFQKQVQSNANGSFKNNDLLGYWDRNHGRGQELKPLTTDVVFPLLMALVCTILFTYFKA